MAKVANKFTDKFMKTKILILGLMLAALTSFAQFGPSAVVKYPYTNTLKASDVFPLGVVGVTNKNIAASNLINAALSAATAGGVSIATIPADVTGNAGSMTNLAGYKGSVASSSRFRLPMKTLSKKNTGQGYSVLWIGDSLVNSYANNIAHTYFQTNLLTSEGTNGWWGGIGLGYNPIRQTASMGTISPTPEVAGSAWMEAVKILTNAASALYTNVAGDGFFSSDRAGIVYVVTNGYSPGTLTLKTVSDADVTNTVLTVSCSGSPRRVFGTNVSFTAGRYKLLVEATGGNAFFSTPGIWSSTATGVRYGAIGYGGLTDYSNADWPAAVAAYDPDLILIHDANNTTYAPTVTEFIKGVQTNLPNVDVCIVGVWPWAGDYIAGEQDLVNNANNFFQLFAETNKNTSFFDSCYLVGNGRSFNTLTNLGLYSDTFIHPSLSNPTLGNAIGKQLQKFLQIEPDQRLQPSLFCRESFIGLREWKQVSNVSASSGGTESPATVRFYDYITCTDGASGSILRRSVPFGYGYTSATYTVYVQATNAVAATYPFYSEAISYTASGRTYTLSSLNQVSLTNGLNVLTITETWPNDTDVREVGLIFADNTNNATLFIGAIKERWH